MCIQEWLQRNSGGAQKKISADHSDLRSGTEIVRLCCNCKVYILPPLPLIKCTVHGNLQNHS